MNKDDSSLPLVVALILAIGLVAVAALVYRSRQASLMTMEAQYQAEAAATQASIRALDQARQSRLESPPLATTPESSTSQRARVDRESLDVLVLDPTGAPVSEATLILFREQSILAQGSTDATGLAHFVAQEGSGEYLIAATGWDLTHGELELSSGRRTLNLIEGAAVAGTVLVDGFAPNPTMELSWNSDSDLTERKFGRKPLPFAVVKALNAARGKRPAIVARTGVDGTFAFRGLSADAAGAIRWSEPYFLETVHPDLQDSARRAVDVPVPTRDLLVRLIAGAELRLRVVQPNGRAMAEALVGLTHEHRDLGSNSLSASADSEGRFAYAFVPKPPERLSISVSMSEVAATQTYEFQPPPGLRGIWDVGDLATRPIRNLRVLVQDTTGKPIRDAQVLPLPGPRSSPNRRTDTDGSIVILVGVDETELVAHAFGYTSARIAFASDAVQVIATLAKACVLEFDMPGYKGKRDGLMLELEGPSPLFAGDKSAPASMRTDSGGFTTRGGSGTTKIEVRPNKSGSWRISGLAPNQTLQAKLREGSKELCSVEIDPLLDGEKRTIPLQVD